MGLRPPRPGGPLPAERRLAPGGRVSHATTTTPRHELKFWLAEAGWAQLIAALGSLLLPDPHGAKPTEPSYTVISLYFDSPRWDAYFEKVEGLKQRCKVRLRRYDRDRTGFLEAKLKHGRRIAKRRCDLDAGDLAAVARGDLRPLRRAADERRDAAAARLLREFALRDLRPAVITRYVRTAYLWADDPALRLTLDREFVCWGKDLPETFLREDADSLPLLEPELRGPGILELKCSGPVPSDAGAFLRRIGAERKSISKYCLAVERARGERGLRTLPRLPHPAEPTSHA
ncbi:MAG: polyphosphate polymerase domain-containing protein [Planctomycetota bacterium]|nr:MAG: polyphosphate polymerase domain-containing protein [Planctomycetota bacterium]